jgi:alanyl-tRNA synthetase
MTAAEIRQSFFDFFREKEHSIVPSAPLLPDSPNLLFTNAGMNQFVPIFLGQQKPGWNPPRVADTQKCIRAGGKHNDLDDVGLDTYHHTFFEMLGNWSFGDYFKKEAIEWAWELVVERWKLPASRLYATVYKPGPGEPSEFDQEAYDHWARLFVQAGLDPAIHIVNGNKKDNFWMMGDTGPCGPCSELHVDLTPAGDTKGSLVNAGDARCIEIWNLVFIQFNANADGTFSPLPQRHVDTGMGLERITAMIQGTRNFTDFSGLVSNYETDVFRPIFDEIERLSGKKYTSTLPSIPGRVGVPPAGSGVSPERTLGTAQKTATQDASLGGQDAHPTRDQIAIDIAFRVIADHIRTLSFAIADGIQPSNEGRGYVLRRILRRAVRYGRTLGFHEPFFYGLVDVLAQAMGGVFPELRRNQSRVQETIRREEETFNRTLDEGIHVFHSFIRLRDDWKYLLELIEPRIVKLRAACDDALKTRPSCAEFLRSIELDAKHVCWELDVRRWPWEMMASNEEKLMPYHAHNIVSMVGVLWDPDAAKPTNIAEVVRRVSVELDAICKGLERVRGELTVFSGRAAFVLYDTYGFPLDLTELLARELGLPVDASGFETNMEKQRAMARAAQKKQIVELSEIETKEATKFVGYNQIVTIAKVLEVARLKEKTALILDESTCYAEMGGQVGDTAEIVGSGQLWRVVDTQKFGNTWLHFVEGGGAPLLGSEVRLTVDETRRLAIERHHTVTHLLHWALHEEVSRDAVQKGSYVGPDKLTFDFSSVALTPQQKRDVEKLVNERVAENAPVSWTEISNADAKKRSDIQQFFGDKYGDTVRVVQIGGEPQKLNGYSMELCGGTHVRATGEIGAFRIVREEAIAAGIRRIEAVAGEAASNWAREEATRQQEKFGALERKKPGIAALPAFAADSETRTLLQQIDARSAHLEKLEAEVHEWQKQQAKASEADLKNRAAATAKELRAMHGSDKAIVALVADADGKLLQSVAEALKSSFSGPIFLAGAVDGRVALIALVPKELTSQFQANKLIQEIAPIVGGKGGGRPDNAQGAGKDVAKINEALARARELLL